MKTKRNQGCAYREQLGADAEGITLLTYLTRRYSHSSKEQWEERIAGGQVLIDSLPAFPGTVLRRGSKLAWNRPPWTEPEASDRFSVLYEDEDILAIDKPPGLPTLPGANFLMNTLLHLVRAYDQQAAPVHRLGRWTSGIVLCSRNPKARAALTGQWSGKEVGKRYRALASGLPSWDETKITTPIGLVPHGLLGSLHAANPLGKPSLSRAFVLERRENTTLCDVEIETGRPHQIRIHLAAAGHPLFGDPLYDIGGLPVVGTNALPGDRGYYLHAACLSFRHPATGRDFSIESEPPALLRTTSESCHP